jgi:UDPglucose--hexose-1-phosphate uridylyltransferase
MKIQERELRRDRLDGRWVIFAPERGRRPYEFHPADRVAPSSVGACPFCPGHEGRTPPEIFALRAGHSRADGPGWRVRVVPNKFGALGAGRTFRRRTSGLIEFGAGTGVHEVIIDTPEHRREWPDLPITQVRDVLAVWRSRLAALETDAAVRFIQLFKNKGREAGASLSHAHTQVIGMPVVPADVARETARAGQERRKTGACPYCRWIASEKALGKRLVAFDSHFIAFAPFASRFPYETRLFPTRHSAAFSGTRDEELASLAKIIRTVLAALRRVACDPPYNIVLRQASVAVRKGDARSAHWSLEILPILTHIAGFELGTGMYINHVFPEQAAEDLRK